MHWSKWNNISFWFCMPNDLVFVVVAESLLFFFALFSRTLLSAARRAATYKCHWFYDIFDVRFCSHFTEFHNNFQQFCLFFLQCSVFFFHFGFEVLSHLSAVTNLHPKNCARERSKKKFFNKKNNCCVWFLGGLLNYFDCFLVRFSSVCAASLAVSMIFFFACICVFQCEIYTNTHAHNGSVCFYRRIKSVLRKFPFGNCD